MDAKKRMVKCCYSEKGKQETVLHIPFSRKRNTRHTYTGFSSALLAALGIMGVVAGSLYAQEGKYPDASGNVILTGTNDLFTPTTVITGTSFPILNFSGHYDFLNEGTIGTNGSGVNQINAAEIGDFTNNGTINYVNGMSASSMINTSAGTIFNSAVTQTGQLIISGNLINNGTIDTGSDLRASDISNTKDIKNYSTISVTNDYTQQNGTLQNIDTLSVGNTITNSGNMDNLITVTAKRINNSGTISNIDGTPNLVGTITVTESLANSGIISNIDQITANNSFTNQNTISNVNTIISNNFNNTGRINDVAKINGRFVNNGEITLTDLSQMKIQNLTTGTASTLQTRLSALNGNPSVPGVDNDFYSINGPAIINGGEVIVKLKDNIEDYKAGDRYTFLKSDNNLEVGESMVISDKSDPLLNRYKYMLSNDDYNYYLSIVRAFRYGEGAPSYNQYKFGTYIDRIADNYVPNSDWDMVLLKLDQLSTGKEISPAGRYALSQMDGAIYGSMSTIAIQNHTIVNNVLANYLRPRESSYSDCNQCCGQNFGAPGQQVNFWGSYYGIDGSVDPDGNAFGGKYAVDGVMVGGDFSLSSLFRFGGFFTYGDSQYQVDGLREQANADNYKAGLYFVRTTNNGYLLGNFNYGWDTYSVERDITFLDRNNTAEVNGTEWAFRVEKGFNFSLGKALFQPFGAFQYLYLKTEEFSENGMGVTALNVDESEYDSYRSEIGARIVRGFTGQRCQSGNLFFQASWLHEYGDTCGSVTSSFTNPNQQNYNGNYKYNVRGVDLGRDWCNLGVGGDYTQNNFSVYGGYDFMISDTQNLHTGNVGLAYKF